MLSNEMSFCKIFPLHFTNSHFPKSIMTNNSSQQTAEIQSLVSKPKQQ